MSTRRLTSIAVFVALICLGGVMSVPIPFTQIEISLSTLFVIMSGLVLGGRDGALAVLIYITMGLAGLPVFTQGGGLGYALTPSFGYLLGFPLAALVSGALAERLKRKTPMRVFLSALAGMAPIYILGIGYQVMILHYYTGLGLAAAWSGVPAVLVLAVKDAALCALMASLYPALYRALRSRRGDREKKLLRLANDHDI